MLSLIAAAGAAHAEASAADVYRRYVGVLGEQTGIVLHLTVMPASGSGADVTGYYYYAKYRRPIALSGAFDGSRFTLTEGEERTGNRLQLTLQGDGLAGEWRSSDGTTTHPVTAKENYDGAVAFDVVSVEETRAYDAGLPGGPSASFSLRWLVPRASVEGQRPDAVRQFVMNCVQRPKTAAAGEQAGGNGGAPPCETMPLQTAPEELARAAAEEYFSEYMQTNAELIEDLCADKPLQQCLDEGMAGGLGWESGESTGVVFNDEGVLALASDYGGYSGGAHGYYGTTVHTFDLAAGRMVRAADLFKPGSEGEIVALLEQAFRDSRGLEAGADIKEALLVESIPLTDNFSVDGNGITFVYVPYEIASYADGQIELTLPWQSLKPHLRDGTIAARLAR